MDILIFDMDGVLLQPRGYHKALQETVRLAGQSLGLENVLLTDAQIAKFEALGISSEWHSSALCLAAMTMQQQTGMISQNHGKEPILLVLEDLFQLIAAQPLDMPALARGLIAIENLADKYHLPATVVREIVENSEAISSSLTMNYFQELILGSKVYSKTYQKPSRLNQDSYLLQFDRNKLAVDLSEKIRRRRMNSSFGAAVMTNRPSSGPPGFAGAPDAQMGIELVGLSGIPVIGYGEILWLAEHTGSSSGTLNKPSWVHALAAILTGSGWELDQSLEFVSNLYLQTQSALPGDLAYLNDSTIIVFEDTPAGIVAVQKAGDLLDGLGVKVQIHKIGISAEETKRNALVAEGAQVFEDINSALASLGNLF
jgi:hypothetical protein